MLTASQKHKLKENWGPRSESLDCPAEVRFYDPLSGWECYIYAMNPDNEDEILCIIGAETVEDCAWSLSELASRFNAEGEGVKLDMEYCPIQSGAVLRKMLTTKSRNHDTR